MTVDFISKLEPLTKGITTVLFDVPRRGVGLLVVMCNYIIILFDFIDL